MARLLRLARWALRIKSPSMLGHVLTFREAWTGRIEFPDVWQQAFRQALDEQTAEAFRQRMNGYNDRQALDEVVAGMRKRGM